MRTVNVNTKGPSIPIYHPHTVRLNLIMVGPNRQGCTGHSHNTGYLRVMGHVIAFNFRQIYHWINWLFRHTINKTLMFYIWIFPRNLLKDPWIIPVHKNEIQSFNMWSSHLTSRGHYDIKMPSCQQRNSHYKDKMVLWPSYLHKGNPYLESQSLYWKGGTASLNWGTETSKTDSCHDSNFVIMLTSSAAIDDKVGIMTTPDYQWIWKGFSCTFIFTFSKDHFNNGFSFIIPFW